MQTEHIKPVTEQNFEAEVLASTVPVLVDFTATWCSPCRALTPILQRVAAEGAGRLKVVTVDGDAESELAARFNVRGYPTVVAFAGGREVARNAGLTSKERILKLVEGR